MGNALPAEDEGDMNLQMTDAELSGRVQRTFESIFRHELPFRADLNRASEPRWTSLQHIEFLIALEKEFKLRFDGADATDMSTMPIVLARLREKLQ
jgi:acyl carrier protein